MQAIEDVLPQPHTMSPGMPPAPSTDRLVRLCPPTPTPSKDSLHHRTTPFVCWSVEVRGAERPFKHV
eukprot:1232962-Prymnesium_polylepis.2